MEIERGDRTASPGCGVMTKSTSRECQRSGGDPYRPGISGQPQAAVLIIVNGEEQALIHPDPQQIGANLQDDLGVAEALQRHPSNAEKSETAKSRGRSASTVALVKYGITPGTAILSR